MPLLECLASLSDAEVVARVLGGETALYELLMRRYNQRVFRVIRSVIANEAEAEDVLQDAWVRAFEHLRQFEGRSSFGAWLSKIAYYEALARARKSKRFVALEGEAGEISAEAEHVHGNEDDPEARAIQGELGQLLRSALDRLPGAYRSVFMLRAVEQLSTAETAKCLDLSEEAVKTRLHRSRSLLRRQLESRLGDALAQSYVFMGHRCDRAVAAVMKRISTRERPARFGLLAPQSSMRHPSMKPVFPPAVEENPKPGRHRIPGLDHHCDKDR